MMLLWLVEDDPALGTEVERLLADDGYEVRRFATAGRFRAALAELDRASPEGAAVVGGRPQEARRGAAPSLVCLDLMLPDGDGRALCMLVKQRLDVPVLMLSALNGVVDRVSGLEVGADDYLGKPFDPRELRARVRALLRRFSAGPVWEQGPWRVEAHARRVLRDGAEVQLSAREFDLFWLFCRHPARVWSRDELAGVLWGEEYVPDSRSIDMLVQRLRKKVEADPAAPRWIETVRQVGYRWRRAP